jgi:organic radical activating enzyme
MRTAGPGKRRGLRVNGWLSELFVSLQGEGSYSGQRQLFVRLSGCNMRCRYCDTPDSLEKTQRCRVDFPGGESKFLDNPVSVETLAAVVARFIAEDPSIAMLAVTGGEPMMQADFLEAWFKASPPERPCLLETNATISRGLDRLLPSFSVVSADVKLPSNSGEASFWKQHEEFLSGCDGVELYVKMPVDAVTSREDVVRGAELVARCAPGATLYLQPLADPGSSEAARPAAFMEELLAEVSARVADTRVSVQMHKVMGLR